MVLRNRLTLIFRLIGFYIYTLPIRIYRFIKEPVLYIMSIISEGRIIKNSFTSLLSMLLLLADVLGFPELMMIAFTLVKRNLRSLNNKEREILELILGKSVPKNLIHINNSADVLTNRGKFAFVSFFFIHSDGTMRDHTFAHELIHIWQYTRFGSKYIVLALLAQRSKEGYNYFGESHLMNSYTEGKDIMAYNFEQQGEILADYFTLLSQKNIIQESTFKHRLYIYDHFIQSARSQKIYQF